MATRFVLFVSVLSSVAFGQRPSPAQTAPGQCECRCAAPQLTLEPAPPIAQCSGVVPSPACSCDCRPVQTLPVNPARPSATLTAQVGSLVRQGRVVVAPEVSVSGPRGAVFVLGASFRDDEPRAAWSPWVTSRRFALGPSGRVSWESFMAEVPDEAFGTPRFQVRLAVFDEAGRVASEARKTLTARPPGFSPTLSDLQFDNAATPAAGAPLPAAERAGDVIRRFASNPYSTQYSGPHPPGVPKAEQQMRHALVAQTQLTPGAPDRPNGTLLEVSAWNGDGAAARQAIPPGGTLRYEIAMAHCSAEALRGGKPAIGRPGGASVHLIRQSAPSDFSFISCAKEGSVAFTRTEDGRLYLAMDVLMTDGSRATESFWIDPMSCRPDPPCF